MQKTRHHGLGLLALMCIPHWVHASLIVSASWSNAADIPSTVLPGDRIDHLIGPAGAEIALNSCVAWRAAEVELLPQQPVTLVGERNGKPMRWAIREGAAKTDFDGMNRGAELLACSVRSALDAHNLQLASSLLGEAESKGWDSFDVDVRAWLLLDGAEYATEVGQSAKALERIEAAAGISGKSESLTRAVALQRALTLRDAERSKEALPYAQEVVDYFKEHAPKSIAYARALTVFASVSPRADPLATIDAAIEILSSSCGQCTEMADALAVKVWKLLARGGEKEALPLAQKAADIMSRLTPIHRRKLAQRLSELATAATYSGDVAAAESAARRALATLKDSSVAELDVAKAHNALGMALGIMGRSRDALAEQQIYAEIVARLAPKRTGVAKNNLGRTLMDLGEIRQALVDLQDAIALTKQYEPGSMNEARAHGNYAQALEISAHYEDAEKEGRRAIAIQESINPKSQGLAGAWAELGRTLMLAGKIDQASEALDRAEAMNSSLDKDCYCLTETLLDLGWLEITRGGAEAAVLRFSRAQQLLRKAVPGGSAYEGEASFGLGESNLLSSSPKMALANLDRAVALLQRDAPDQTNLALAINARARAYRELGENKNASRDFCAAADVLQRASRRVGTDSLAESVFRSRHADVFRDCVEAELREKNIPAALLRLESSRSRSFVDALATRQSNVSRRAPHVANLVAQIDEAYRERARIQRDLNDSGLTMEQRGALAKQLTDWGKKRERWVESLRRSAPEIAALEGQGVESLDRIRRALPEKAIAIEYSVGFKDTLLFVLEKNRPVQVYRILKGSPELTVLVSKFRATILNKSMEDTPSIRGQGTVLFDILLGPARGTIDTASTLIMSPDGPLFDLPFAALWDSTSESYLGPRVPITLSDSLTSWTHLSQRRSPGHTTRQLAIADPEIAPSQASTSTDARPVAAEAAALNLPRLPGAQYEVEAIRNIAPDSTDVLVGAGASEVAVTNAAPNARILHFAVHTLLDARRPLDSTMVLRATTNTPVGDGFLHAQEIFDSYDLAADLVVLSGCDTGRGAVLQGEGLIGFTRAFEYAGADGVLASLWPVADQPTAVFMRNFYRALATGMTSSQALHDTIQNTAASRLNLALVDTNTRGTGGLAPPGTAAISFNHPYIWAGFQLFGAATNGASKNHQ